MIHEHTQYSNNILILEFKKFDIDLIKIRLSMMNELMPGDELISFNYPDKYICIDAVKEKERVINGFNYNYYTGYFKLTKK